MKTTNHIYYAATNRGFIKASGEFTHNIRLAYPFASFDLAELITKEEIAKGNCRNYYAILQTVVSPSDSDSNSDAEGIRGTTYNSAIMDEIATSNTNAEGIVANLPENYSLSFGDSDGYCR